MSFASALATAKTFAQIESSAIIPLDMRNSLGNFLFLSTLIHGLVICGLGTGAVYARSKITLSNDVTGALISFVANQSNLIEPVMPELPKNETPVLERVEEVVQPNIAEEAAQKLVDEPMARLTRAKISTPVVDKKNEVADSRQDFNALNRKNNAPLSSGMGSGDTNKVRIISAPKPPYPPRALKLGFEGNVTLDLKIARDGDVVEARVKRSSGRTDCDLAAVNTALKYWRFSPATLDRRPVESTEEVVVVYKIDR
jgi:TonB family protein